MIPATLRAVEASRSIRIICQCYSLGRRAKRGAISAACQTPPSKARCNQRCVREVGLGRVELPTSPLSGVRSNRLSYSPATDERSATFGELWHLNQPTDWQPVNLGQKHPLLAGREAVIFPSGNGLLSDPDGLGYVHLCQPRTRSVEGETFVRGQLGRFLRVGFRGDVQGHGR